MASNRMSRTLCAVAVVSLLTAAWAASGQGRGPADLANAPVPPGARRIAYGSDPLHFGELRLPAGVERPPVAIVVHGGCWVAELGALDPRAVAIDNMRPMAAALTDAGVATWNIEYRRVGHAGGGWPGTYQDVALAADTLRTIARQYPLDLTRVISIGHSAGGHLALWLAGRARIPSDSELYVKDPIRVTAAVNLDGPADLGAMLAAQEAICRRPVITELMGGSPAERPDRYRAASPIALLPLGVRIQSFAGRAFGEQNTAFDAAATKGGDSIESTTIPTAGHFVFIDPQSDVWPQIVAAVRRLLGVPTAA
jgi:acetyl esterase/lipase